MLSADAIVALHDQRTRAWHREPATAGEDARPHANSSAGEDADEDAAAEWPRSLTLHHRANFDLWHIEDEARTPDAADAELAAIKRRIDTTNQLRNDLAEKLDRALTAWLEERGLPNPAAPLNSESPGLIIDRLSILALKIYHTREEAGRTDAPEGHAARNQERLRILEEQRADLAGCLDALWRETLAGTRRFNLYRQLKMYNDPSLNPVVYRKLGAGQGR
ncbi:MAG: DUF4254 domain-containing protein [Acidobacteriota bacterium]|nr:DUF4254 domain-containing protein [Acidobacteriota bacterium]